MLVARGGGDDGLASDRALATREAVAEQAYDGAQTGATEQDTPTTDEAEPGAESPSEAEPLDAGLPSDVALGETVG